MNVALGGGLVLQGQTLLALARALSVEVAEGPGKAMGLQLGRLLEGPDGAARPGHARGRALSAALGPSFADACWQLLLGADPGAAPESSGLLAARVARLYAAERLLAVGLVPSAPRLEAMAESAWKSVNSEEDAEGLAAYRVIGELLAADPSMVAADTLEGALSRLAAGGEGLSHVAAKAAAVRGLDLRGYAYAVFARDLSEWADPEDFLILASLLLL